MLAYGAFEDLEPAFTPTPATPDANDWIAAMDAEVNNMRRLNVFKEVPRPINRNIPLDGCIDANSKTARLSNTKHD